MKHPVVVKLGPELIVYDRILNKVNLEVMEYLWTHRNVAVSELDVTVECVNEEQLKLAMGLPGDHITVTRSRSRVMTVDLTQSTSEDIDDELLGAEFWFQLGRMYPHGETTLSPMAWFKSSDIRLLVKVRCSTCRTLVSLWAGGRMNPDNLSIHIQGTYK